MGGLATAAESKRLLLLCTQLSRFHQTFLIKCSINSHFDTILALTIAFETLNATYAPDGSFIISSVFNPNTYNQNNEQSPDSFAPYTNTFVWDSPSQADISFSWRRSRMVKSEA